MAAGGVGVVGDQNVPGFDADARSNFGKMLAHRLDGVRHAADERGQAQADGNRFARSGEQAGGEIQGLVDDRVVGGSGEIDLHLFGHRHHAVADDLGEDGVRPSRPGCRPGFASFLCRPSRGLLLDGHVRLRCNALRAVQFGASAPLCTNSAGQHCSRRGFMVETRITLRPGKPGT